MKTINLKTIFIIIFLSLFITSCTDLESDDDLLIDNIESTQFTGGNEPIKCNGKNC